jgi:hypothetical protein
MLLLAQPFLSPHKGSTSVLQAQIFQILKMLFCKEVPGGFDSLQKHPWFALRPSEGFGTLQCDPWGGGRRGSGQIPVAGDAGGWGKRWGRSRGSPHVYLRPETGWGWCRRGDPVAPGSGGRCGSCCGDGAARPRQSEALRDVTGPEENTRGICLQRRWSEVVVPLQRQQWRRRAAQWAAGGRCTRRRLEAFYTRALSCFAAKGGNHAVVQRPR